MTSRYLCVLVLVFIFYYEWTFAKQYCKGMKVKTIYLRHCEEPAQPMLKVNFNNLSYHLTDDCLFIPRGCFEVLKPFKDCKVYWSFERGPLLKKNGELSLCECLEDEDIKAYCEQYNEVHKMRCDNMKTIVGKHCVRRNFTDISSFHNYFHLAKGESHGKTHIKCHEPPSSFCMEWAVKIEM